MTQASWQQRGQQDCLATLLARLVIILGLLNIPVECAVVVGPHSMFLAPATVASLQQLTPEPGSSFHAAHHHVHVADQSMHAVTNSEGTMALGKRAEQPDNQQYPTMPTPAGFASDAIPLRVIAGPVGGPRLVGLSPRPTTWTPPLQEQEFAGPKPPPPNLG